MPSFYNGRRFFLTYARCDREAIELRQFFESKASCKYVLVAREKHEDGAYHLHACVEFRTIQRHGVAWLDFQGKHPNKQDPRKWEACKQYCKKDGEFIETEAEAEVSMDVDGIDLSQVCQGFDEEEAWMSHCVNSKIGYQYATWFWNRIHGDMSTILGDEHEGKICDALKNFDYGFTKTLVLKGASGTGKTTWAKINAPKPALFVTHVDELKSFRTGYHKSIIFDDVDFNHYPRTSQIAIVDYENPRQIHCRHAVARIPAGIAKIFTCNVEPINVLDEAIRRRIRVVNII